MINPSNAPFFPGVEELLSWTSRRQQALAGNVANMDTPGYRAHDYSLEREMTEITKNGLQYITLVQYLNQKIRTLRAAINEGGKV
jgi:flagellar basal body rod protein FlgB